MPKVVSIASPKGGCGKSTLTALIASELAALGKTVLVIDADPQASTTLWQQQCLQNEVPLPNMDFVQIVDPAELGRRILGDEVHDVIIIDNQGVANERMSVAIRNSDIILVPSHPIVIDLVEAAKVVNLARALDAKGPPTPVRIVMNGYETFDKRSPAFIEAIEFIRQTKLPMAATVLKQRMFYKNLMAGRTLSALPSKSPNLNEARWDVHDLISEVQTILNVQLIANAA